jgi:hypothetical protein
VTDNIACVFAKEEKERNFEKREWNDGIEFDWEAEGVDEKNDCDDRQCGSGK